MPSPASNAVADEIRSILIVRVSSIGDVLMTSPVAHALREAYPQARISWVIERMSAPIIQANPYVDEVILVETGRWQRLLRQGQWAAALREVRAFAREMRERRFDLVVDIHGLLKSGMIAAFTRAPRRIGPSPSREGNFLFMTELTPWDIRPTRLADIYLAVLKPLGIAMTPRRPILAIPAEESRQAEAFLEREGLDAGRYVACCISSSRPQKDWPWERWSELADLLLEREGLRTVLIGGPERKEVAARVAEASTARPVAAAGALPLLVSAAVVQRAAGVVGVDTGLTYAGLATDTPTVALYGSTSDAWLDDEPYTAVVKHPLPCSPCNRRPICRQYDCMRMITAEEVADALRAVMMQPVTA